MLPKNRRIPRQLFPEILTRGKRLNSPHLLLYILSGNKLVPSRFSFSVSKKVCKLATDRNTYRRRGYSVISGVLEKIAPGFLCLFSFKKGSGLIKFEAMKDEITELLYSANMLG